MEMIEHCDTQVVGELFTTHLCISQQTISNYFVKEELSMLLINAPAKALTLMLTGISLQFEFDFKVSSDPEWLVDSGQGSISVAGCDMNLALELKNDNGNLKVDYSDARMRTRDYTVDLAGSSDISRAVEKMLKDFKVYF